MTANLNTKSRYQYITKSKDEADFVVSIEKGSENRVEIVKELKDPSNTHKYSFQSVLTVVAEKMKKENIRIDYEKGFNSYVLNLIIDFYDVKREQRFSLGAFFYTVRA